MTGTPFEEIPLDVISLLGKDALILHAPGLDVPSPGLGGRDVDCALSDLSLVTPTSTCSTGRDGRSYPRTMRTQPETMPPAASDLVQSEWIPRLAPLIGRRVLVLHRPDSGEADTGLSGTDVDCVVDGLDPMWPLRLPREWRLCQSLHYDLCGWYWVLERDGDVIALDTIDDPLGLGRDGIRTKEFFFDGAVSDPLSSVRAAYLAIKRLRKSTLSAPEWARIGRLAQEDVDAFGRALRMIGGDPVAKLIGKTAVAGVPPDRALLWRVAALRNRRRFASPTRAATALVLGARRYAERIRYPTGLFVLVAGPDGTGKSTLASKLPVLCRGMFKRHLLSHWRPNLLPRPGALLRLPAPDPTRPHARPPHGTLGSLILTGYYWLDFVLGGGVLSWSILVRAGLLVRERGWWDLAVDPRRYRLSVPPQLVRALGGFVRHPHVAIVLEASPDVLASRKSELGAEEAVRQIEAWRTVLPWRVNTAFVNTDRPLEEVQRQAREVIHGELESRTVAHLGAGWLTIPGRASPRWWLPRGREYASSALSIYQPVTWRARAGWESARLAGALGSLQLLPRGSAPPREVRAMLAPHLPPRSTIAVSRANHPGRFIALIVGDNGDLHAVAKVATNEPGHAALAVEREAIERLGEMLPSPLESPHILAAEPGLLLMKAVPWRARPRPWELTEEVATGLGKFFSVGRADGADGPVGPAHGDCAPWNILRTGARWTLVDWEAASDHAPPFHDLCHYIVQSYALLHRPGVRGVVDGFIRRSGWMGRAIRAYADAAGVAAEDAAEYLVTYLKGYRPESSHMRTEEARGTSRRARLAAELGARS
jgi:hypothetical protein